MIDAERLIALEASGERALVLTVLEGEQLGAKAIVRLVEGNPQVEGEASIAHLGALVERGRGLARSAVLVEGGVRVLVDVFGPRTRLIVVGAYDVAEALCGMARQLGWRSAVVDARERFATPERIPSADELVVAWPAEGLAQLAPDESTAVVVLAHDHKFDVPALAAALETPAFYVGALGSRRNQARRHPRLLEAGVEEAAIDRICAPCGLDIGGETPAETAVSIVAEVIARRTGRTGGPLVRAEGSIHGDGPPPEAVALAPE